MAATRMVAPARALAAVCILVIVLATTWPWGDFQGHAHWDKVEWMPFTHRLVPLDLLLNIILFIPLGAFTRIAWPRVPAWAIIAVAAFLSLSVETYQLFSHSRFPATADLLTNIAGCWMGTTFATRYAIASRR